VSVCCRLAAPVPEEWAQDSDFLAEKMRRTPVREIMSIAVTCVDSELGHEEIEEVFDKTHTHSAPVVEDRGVLIGIVSREDLLRMRPETPGATCCVVDEVMNTRVPKLAESASLADAAIRLAASGTQPLVVVSKDDAVVGTVSPMDLVRWIAGTLAG
jgi:CBS domain-containing protein